MNSDESPVLYFIIFTSPAGVEPKAEVIASSDYSYRIDLKLLGLITSRLDDELPENGVHRYFGHIVFDTAR